MLHPKLPDIALCDNSGVLVAAMVLGQFQAGGEHCQLHGVNGRAVNSGHAAVARAADKEDASASVDSKTGAVVENSHCQLPGPCCCRLTCTCFKDSE